MPDFPIRAAFYYPWYPDHWEEGTRYTPMLGEYDSSAAATIDQHIADAQYARLDLLIASWWGQSDSFGTDAALPHLLARTEVSEVHPNLKWAIYFEMESQIDPTAASIAADMAYLETRAFNSPAYLRINNKPVVFVYAAPTINATVWARWAAARTLYGKPLYIVAQVYEGWGEDANGMDSWHQYTTIPDYSNGAAYPYSMTVQPGFWRPDEEDPQLERDPQEFADALAGMVNAAPDFQLVTTFNEWGEGSQIEPSAEFTPSTQYLDLLRAAFTPQLTHNTLGERACRLFDDLGRSRNLELLMFLNETSTPVYDRTRTNRLTGSVIGLPAFNRSLGGGHFKGMDFGAATAIVLSSATPFDWEYTQAFTVLAIINPTVGATTRTIYSKYDGTKGIIFQNDDSGLLGLAILNGSNILYKATSAALTSGAEVMVGVTYSGSGTAAGALLYVNGVQPAQTAVADTLGANTVVNSGSAIIGSAGAVNIWDGSMGLVAILKRVATPAEMKRWAHLAGYY